MLKKLHVVFSPEPQMNKHLIIIFLTKFNLLSFLRLIAIVLTILKFIRWIYGWVILLRIRKNSDCSEIQDFVQTLIP